MDDFVVQSRLFHGSLVFASVLVMMTLLLPLCLYNRAARLCHIGPNDNDDNNEPALLGGHLLGEIFWARLLRSSEVGLSRLDGESGRYARCE